MKGLNFPGYDIIREIGRGGMATVYCARQVMLDREVALKVLSPSLAAEPVNAQRFLQEARMLASLEHPHVVPVYDVGVTPDGAHYFSMQLLENGDLTARLQRGMELTEVVEVIAAVAEALGYAHARGYVHRDVTPTNILFDAENKPRLTDFGIARAMALTSRITASGLSVGTSHYMSPEQARGGEVDPRSDIYALGVVCYEALTGHTPFTGEDSFAVAYAHVYEPVPPLPETLARWQPLIDRCMAKNPEDRFQDCVAFNRALRQIATSLKNRKPGSPEELSHASALPTSGQSRAPDLLPMPEMQPPDAEDATAPRWLGPVLGLAGLVVVLIAFAIGYSGNRDGAVSESTVPAIVDDPGRADARGDGDEGNDQDGDPGAETDAAGLQTVVDPIPVLLRQAQEDIAARRYSSPPERNALARYQWVLRIEPGNAEARAGIERVVGTYLQLADEHVADEDPSLWLGYLQRAEELATHFDMSTVSAEAGQRRQQRLEQMLTGAKTAVAQWDRDRAVLLYERAQVLAPDDATINASLKRARRVGNDGFVFHDQGEGQAGPDMIVIRGLAYSRTPITLGQFRAYWQARGSERFGAAMPSCRDRESTFRSSRRRTFLDPGFSQGENHPVVCVSAAMADDYARWLSRITGKVYRLPGVEELRAAGVGVQLDCRAGNFRDASYRELYGGRGEVAPCRDGHGATSPVLAFASNRQGLRDASGNVREWSEDCQGAGCSERQVLGASWATLPDENAVQSFPAQTGFNTIGFRVVRNIP